ncbi:uncharacterized protein V1518DRAFT_421821 [Limtongia smithiae]|uniref:uncharacterized protein n=1 Tax=Limtongia smithiae TaxID=1125753 RepID=UPI0034D00F1F
MSDSPAIDPPLTPVMTVISVAPYLLYCHLTIFPRPDSVPSPKDTSIAPEPLILNVALADTPVAMSLSVFVYSIPIVASTSKQMPVSTTLLGGKDSASQEAAEFATRLSRALALHTKRPVYVGVAAGLGRFLPQVEAAEKILAFVQDSLR